MTYILSNYCKLLEIRIDYLFRPRNDYHVLQTFNSNWESSIIGKTIYAFHMPLFMLISGYFFYPSVKKQIITTL